MTSHDDELTDNSIGTKGHPCPTCGWPFVKPVAPPAKKEDSPYRHRFAPDSYYEPVAPPAGELIEPYSHLVNPSPSPAIGDTNCPVPEVRESEDVEKLIERVQRYITAGPLTDEIIATLRSLDAQNSAMKRESGDWEKAYNILAAEKAKVEEQANNLKRYVGEYASEIEALRAEKAKVEEDLTRYMDIANEHVNECEALRAKLERAREGLLKIAHTQPLSGSERIVVERARATLEEISPSEA